MSVLTAYATLTGTNPEQLSFRLSWLARQYLGSIVPKPGRPARLDAYSDEAQFMADALDDAARILVECDPAVSRTALVEAVRRAEARWQKVQTQLSRGGTTWADLRPPPGPDRPAARVPTGDAPRRLTLVHDSATVEAARAADARVTQARRLENRAAAQRRANRNRLAEKAAARHDQELGRGR
jgi:hypothetical protein